MRSSRELQGATSLSHASSCRRANRRIALQEGLDDMGHFSHLRKFISTFGTTLHEGGQWTSYPASTITSWQSTPPQPNVLMQQAPCIGGATGWMKNEGCLPKEGRGYALPLQYYYHRIHRACMATAATPLSTLYHPSSFYYHTHSRAHPPRWLAKTVQAQEAVRVQG